MDKTNQTKIIYLRRQGTSEELNSNNAINDELDYFICIRKRRITTKHERSLKRYVPDPNEGKYTLEIRYSSKYKKWGNKRGLLIPDCCPRKYYQTFKGVRNKASRLILQVFGQRVYISKTIERYGHNRDPKSIIDRNDKFLAVCFYYKNSDIIKLQPENYCLIDFNKTGTEDFIQISTTTEKYLSILKNETVRFEKEINNPFYPREPDDHLKERLTWLIGESIKRAEPGRQLLICDSLIKYF